MAQSYLEVTFRRGRVLAAYYYLPRREGDRVVRVAKHDAGLLVDLAADGRPLGIELAIPSLVTVESLNAVLAAYNLAPIDPLELTPLNNAA